MVQDDIKNKLATDANSLKNNVTSPDTSLLTKDTLTDTVINNDSINKIVPVKQMKEGLQQIGAVKETIQSTITSGQNISTDTLVNNELAKKHIPSMWCGFR